ncbi:hypothetical protein FM106_19035 [Brachybacterium faecium]|nr:hypothetical protein FM106_19035 [Brachybacterium faecium]
MAAYTCITYITVINFRCQQLLCISSFFIRFNVYYLLIYSKKNSYL